MLVFYSGGAKATDRRRSAGTHWRAAVKPLSPAAYPRRLRPLAIFRNSRLHPFLDQAQHSAIGHTVLDKLQCPFVTQIIEEATDVCVKHPVHSLPLDAHRQCV